MDLEATPTPTISISVLREPVILMDLEDTATTTTTTPVPLMDLDLTTLFPTVNVPINPGQVTYSGFTYTGSYKDRRQQLQQEEKQSRPEFTTHVVVDSLNFIFGVLGLSMRKPELFGHMLLDRTNSKNILHGWDRTDMICAMTILKKFVTHVFPASTCVHFVTKKLPAPKWSLFKECYDDVFSSDLAGKYKFIPYVALHSDPSDSECDDRLTVRLAIELITRGERVFLLTNDKYRSLVEHWFNSCTYVLAGQNHSLSCSREMLQYVDQLNRIGFHVGCGDFDNSGSREIKVKVVS